FPSWRRRPGPRPLFIAPRARRKASTRRAYWTTYHETARDLLRVRSVADFLQELVSAERHIFL
ncbi:hypothetical protein ACCT19_36765, partial [Rhizobium ruizarguesonis]